MDLSNLSVSPLLTYKVAVIGYGNQGRAHALNLRDSGVSVLIGARPGKGFDAAKADGFSPLTIQEAARQASVVVFLLPDQLIGSVYTSVRSLISGKYVGFAHGFSYVYSLFEKDSSCHYFLAGPKGAGVILRERYVNRQGLPGVYAVGDKSPDTEKIATAYAKAIGIADKILLKTTFQEETECDLFGEQAVLCGGIFELMERSFEVLVKNGHSPEMAFFETCFESKLILDLWMKYGPKGVREKISPTAFYGGLTRGKRVLGPEVQTRLEEVFAEVRSGKFAKEWMTEVDNGTPTLEAWKKKESIKPLEETYQKLKDSIL